MTRRRSSPEEYVEPSAGPLWDAAAAAEQRSTALGGLLERASATAATRAREERAAARDRAELGMTRAASRTQRIDPGWRSDVLAKIKAHAENHEAFLAEDVREIDVPEGSDPRAIGSVFQSARRAKWIEPGGWAPANTSNRSAKVLWHSLIFVGGAS